MQPINNATYAEIAAFLGGLTDKLKPDYKEWGYTTEETWANKRKLTERQLTWVKTTAKFQRKTIPASMLGVFPELSTIDTFTGTKAIQDTPPPAPDADDELDQREVIAIMLSDMATALMKAASALRLQ